MTDKKYTFDERPMDESETDGTKKTAEYRAAAIKAADEKAEAVSTTPAVEVASDKISTEAPAEKVIDEPRSYASNDGEFVLSKLDDGTTLEPGNVMENQAREPAHQQHELAVEEDAPGFEQTAALMTPRGNPHYNEGGSVAEVKAGREFGEA